MVGLISFIAVELEQLNGSPVSPKERTLAERYYLTAHFKASQASDSSLYSC
jgi:hypothetical protein